MKKYYFLFFLAGFLSCFLYLTWRSNSSVTIRLEVPENYRGVVSIIEQKAASNWTKKWALTIGNSGNVSVPHLRPFERWHKIRARFSDGTPLRFMNDGGTGGIAIWPLPTRAGLVRFYIGEEKDFKAFRMNETWGKPLSKE